MSWRGRRGIRIWQGWHSNLLTRLQAGVRFGAAAIDADLTRAEQFLEPAVADSGIVRSEPAIEAQALFISADVLDLDAANCRNVRASARPAKSAMIDKLTEAPR